VVLGDSDFCILFAILENDSRHAGRLGHAIDFVQHQFKVEKSKGKIWSANALKISKTFVLIVS
jgi:hypothetical protein